MHLSTAASVQVFPSRSFAASRTFTITNSCSETLWTAITNFGEHQTYTGARGFEQASGNTTEVTIPSPWNGRIWPRRKCEFDDDGEGSCVTGDCDGLLECKDGTIGTVNVGEFNLDSWEGNDCWTVPMLIEPQGDGCNSVSCTQDVNAACPDERMKVKDDDGNTLACIAACFAGINAKEPSMNCCSGKYNALDACISDQVDYYDVLKPLCENAYWYPYDSRQGYPTVDFACSSSGDPGYKIEYCPSGSDSGVDAGAVQSSIHTSTPAAATSKSATAAIPTSPSTAVSASSISSSTPAATTSASDGADTASTILGVSRSSFLAAAVAVVAAILVALVFFLTPHWAGYPRDGGFEWANERCTRELHEFA
ncbi:hypothetical protein JCM6882_000165 [Rhodosporidiobolus microsporus]